MDTVTCPRCGTVNPTDAMNCKHCRINLKFARENLVEIERSERGTVEREQLNESQRPDERKALAEKHRSKMIRGLLLAIAGIVVTAATYSAASEGDTCLICWGAILFGIIDFLAGLMGWLTYSS
jgi:hypothetical protein